MLRCLPKQQPIDKKPMNLDEIRRLIIVAVCSDDVLLDTLVLKG